MTIKKSLAAPLLCAALAACAARPVDHARLGPVVNDEILSLAADGPKDSALAAAVKDGVRKLRRGRYEAAGKRFSEGLRLNPTDGGLHFLNALSYHLRSLSGDQSMLENAEAGYALSLRFDKDNFWAAYLLGHVYFEQKRYLDAQNQFAYAALFSPENPVIMRALAVASYYAKEFPMSRWAAERSVKADPKSPASWRAAALARAAEGDIAGAREGLKGYRAVLVADASPRARYALETAETSVDAWESLVAQGQPSVFGSGSGPEGRVMDLGDKSDNYDDSKPQAPAPPPAAPKPAGKAAPSAAPKAALPRMTLVDVVIVRTEETRTQNKGVNILDGIKATLSGTLYAFNRVTGYSAGGAPADARTHTFAPTLSLSGLQYNLNIFNDGMSRAEVLARPSLLALDGKPSQFYSGSVLHVQLNSNLSDGTVVDIPVGITLNVTPTFVDDETVNISVHAERSFIESQNAKLGFTVFSQTAKTSVDANATLRFGDTMILSGLAENETARSRSGVPFLQSVPVLQYFFSNKNVGEFKTSVLVLLSPNKYRLAEGEIVPTPGEKASGKPVPQTEYTARLRRKEKLSFTNADAAMGGLARSAYMRELRTGDLRLDEWHDSDSMFGALKRALGFLYF